MAFTRSGTVAHSALSGVTADQHQDEAHTAVSHSDQGATGAELDTLTDGSDSDALHTHPIHPTEATAAQVAAETVGVLFAPTDLIRQNPMVPKFFVTYNYVTGTPTVIASDNVDSLTDTATGQATVVITTDFAADTWFAFGNTGSVHHLLLQAQAVGSVISRIANTSHADDDGGSERTHAAGIGAQ